jgi:hypothetical protein
MPGHNSSKRTTKIIVRLSIVVGVCAVIGYDALVVAPQRKKEKEEWMRFIDQGTEPNLETINMIGSDEILEEKETEKGKETRKETGRIQFRSATPGKALRTSSGVR